MIKLLTSTCLAIGLLAVAQVSSAATAVQPAVSSTSVTTPAAKKPVTTLAETKHKKKSGKKHSKTTSK